MKTGHPRVSVYRHDTPLYGIYIPTLAGRTILIYDPELNRKAMSEDIDQLEDKIHWKPSGELITSTQLIKGRKERQVVFFEPNGLRHGEFALKTDGRILNLEWNADGNILAVSIASSTSAIGNS